MATISFVTTFDLTLSPKQFIFEDTTDYVGQGIAEVNVNGCFKITAPSGTVVYNNTDFSNSGCDIRIAVDRFNQSTMQLPLTTASLVEPGQYIIEYSVYNSSAVETYTETETYSFTYISPVICIEQTVDCLSPLFTSTDATDYVVSGFTPALIRQHILQYPLGSGASNTVTATVTISRGSGQFYTGGTQTTQINTSLQYTFTDGLTVKDYVTGAKEIVPECTEICDIYCGLRSIEQQMVAASGNLTEYNRLKSLFSQIMSLVELAQLSIQCGKSDDTSGYLTLIKALGNFTGDCCCTGDTPTAVVGLNGIINEVICESVDLVVLVTPVVAGNTTTYQFALDPEFIENAILPNLFEVGSGNDSLQTRGNDADAAGNASISIGLNSEAAGTASVSLGNEAVCEGADSVAIGDAAHATNAGGVSMGANADGLGVGAVTLGINSQTQGDYAISIGDGSKALDINTVAIGHGALGNIAKTVQIQGAIITRRDLGEGDSMLNFAGALVTITTEEIDLKVAGPVFTINITSGAKFFPDEIDLVVTNANTVTVQPFIRAGITGTAAKLLAIVQTTALTATYDRQRFATLLSAGGESSLRVDVTTGATATTMKGRFVFRGLLIENE